MGQYSNADMPAADVVYHKQCSVTFYTGKQMPQTFARRQSDAASAAKCPTNYLFRGLSNRRVD